MTVTTKGLLFQVRNAGDTAWITVGGAHNIDLPMSPVNDVEEPDFANTVRVTRPGRRKVGQGSVDVTWNKADLGQVELEALKVTNEVRDMKIVLVDGDATLTLDNLNWSGRILDIDYTAAESEDSIWMSRVFIKPTTKVTRSAT